MKTIRLLFTLAAVAFSAPMRAAPQLILHHGKIVTVDGNFSIVQAVAVDQGRIVQTGDDREILALRGPATEVINLENRTVLPGLIDSHVHPEGACMTEFDHPIPDMETVTDVLAYIRDRAKALGPGKWVSLSQVFITRLRDQRYPTKAELDAAAPVNPVIFATGPDASLNTLALKLSGIDRNFRVSDGGPGRVELDPATGEPTGILRSCTRFVKVQPSERQPTESDRYRRTMDLFHDYNGVGITTIGDRDASPSAIRRYKTLRDNNDLTVRISVSQHVDTTGPLE